jgi:hypothetical protein
MKQNLLDAALAYAEKGFSVIPVQSDKKPYVKWEPFQKRKADPEEIKGWWTEHPTAMIGIVTGSISGISVIDIDEHQGQEEIQRYIPDSLLIPTAQTPRGGQHLYFSTPTPPIANNTRIIPGCDFRGEGGYIISPPSMNGTGKPYSWLPGLSLAEVDLPALPEPYILLINKCMKGGLRGEYRGDVTQVVTLFTQGRRDNDLFHVANALAKGGMPENEIVQVIELLAQSCNPPFPQNEIKAKVESAIKRLEKREINLSEEVRAFISVTNGYFSVTECFKTIQTVTTVIRRDNIRQILHRLFKEGAIEKYGNQDGVYRRVENQCKEIDFLHVTGERLEIRYPFGIERYSLTLPKNIIIVAGESNAGKTAFLLNFVRLNMGKHKIHYFSSEMGALELRSRLSKFGDISLDKWNFKAKERSSNFADVIQPDDLNAVDFLEMSDEFYKIGGHIKDIFDKLNKGIAIIAIQKNRGTDYGLGGARSLEKARLYLSMESGKIKITKAKNWAGQVNPNGLELDFKLIQGCIFQPESDWHKGN